MKRRDFLSTFLAASATLLPLATAAQQRAGVRRIAIVNPSGSAERLTEESNRRYYGPFFEELRRLGYVEGQNLTVLRYSGEGRPDNYTELARTVVDAAPELIFVVTGRLTSYFKAATTTLPLLPSPPTRLCRDSPPIWRPGGNITGVVVDAGIEVEAKRVELLHQLVPQATRIGYLTSRSEWESTQLREPVRAAAVPLGVTIVPALLERPIDDAEFRRVFDVMTQQGVDALVVGSAQENYPRQQLIIQLAQDRRLPASYPEKVFIDQGGLLSSGPYFPDLYRQAANYITRILDGVPAGELPFYRSTKFELVINLKTARALGLAVPPLLLARADEIIE